MSQTQISVSVSNLKICISNVFSSDGEADVAYLGIIP